MKKNYIIAFILSTSIVFSACTGYKTTETKAPEAAVVTASPTETVVETEKNFTEGIWIKKYSDNYACFKFESPEGYQIICDPYNIDETLQPDIVMESHQDQDHVDTTNLEPPYELITEPGEYNFNDIVIHGYAGQHNIGNFEGKFKGTNNIFVISMNDITIAHFASQGKLPSDELLEQIGSVDILLIQAFVDPNANKMVVKDAGIIISKLSPKIVIPEHGDPSMGGILAKLLNVTEEVEDSGNLFITRDMLDKIYDVRVINLDNNKE